MDKQTAEKAAKWWADQLRPPAKLDNGDDSQTGGMVVIMAMMAQDAERSSLSNEKIGVFETELTASLIKTDPRTVSVDYNPDRILSKAAASAGINPGIATFPWKTIMFFNGDKVSVREGYGAESVTL